MLRYSTFSRVLATGAPAPLAEVTVYAAGTLNPSTIFDDDLSPPTAKANPFLADGNGFFFFYAANGRYDVRVAPVGSTAYTMGDQWLGGPPTLDASTFAALPTASTNVGLLRRVTDGVRGLWYSNGTDWLSVAHRRVDIRAFGAKGDGVTNDTAAFTNAIAALDALGGIIDLPPGTYLHDGITLNKKGVVLKGHSRATILKRSGTGSSPNVTASAESNYCQIEDLRLEGPATSTHGIHLIDAAFTRIRNVEIVGWGSSSSGIRLDTVNNPNGNGTYFTELEHLEINGTGVTNGNGIHQTGTAAGANRVRMYGGRVTNCTTGIRLTNGDSFTSFETEFSGCTTALHVDSAGATTSCWIRPSFESNTTHLNLAAGADHVFLFPSFSSPGVFGTDNAARTVLLLTDAFGSNSKLGHALDVRHALRSFVFSQLASPVNSPLGDTTPVTLANTVVETTLKSVAVPASSTGAFNTLQVGDVYEWELVGVYSTANATDTITLRFLLTGGALGMAAVSPAASVTNAPWRARFRIIITAVGSAGTAEVSGEVLFNATTVRQAVSTGPIALGSVIGAHTWGLNGLWSAALAGNTITVRHHQFSAIRKQQ